MNLIVHSIGLFFFMGIFHQAFIFHQEIVCRQEIWLKGVELTTSSKLEGGFPTQSYYFSQCSAMINQNNNWVTWKSKNQTSHQLALGIKGKL